MAMYSNWVKEKGYGNAGRDDVSTETLKEQMSTASEQEKDYRSLIAHVHHRPLGQCIYCNHCLPCPEQIDIGQTIRLLEMAQQGHDARPAYEAMSANASHCTQCGACEVRCPFGVKAMVKMTQAATLF